MIKKHKPLFYIDIISTDNLNKDLLKSIYNKLFSPSISLVYTRDSYLWYKNSVYLLFERNDDRQ